MLKLWNVFVVVLALGLSVGCDPGKRTGTVLATQPSGGQAGSQTESVESAPNSTVTTVPVIVPTINTARPAVVTATPRFAVPTIAPSVYYANCTEARRAGAAPLRRGQPGYRAALDRNNDGVACE